MNERERKLRLNELGREIALMHPEKVGAVIFDIVKGKLTGVRENNGWRTGSRPAPPVADGY